MKGNVSMTKADSVLSTPPTNTSLSRRNMIGAMATVGAAAIATTAPAIAGLAEPDPIYAAIEAFRRADASCVAVNGDIPDELGDRLCAASKAVMRTRPTTPAGLAALTTWARGQADEMESHSVLFGEDFCALTAAIDDAARGMSGLKPWSPPLLAAPALTQPPAKAAITAHPDAELFAASDRYLAGLSEYAACALAFGEVNFIEPRPRGYVSKERAYLRTMKHFGKMERKLVNIRPKTLDGLFAKARALEADLYVSEDLRESVLKDLFGMGRGKAVA